MMWSSYELLAVLWRASWQATVLAAVVYALCRVFHRMIPASAKTLLWTVPILRLLMLVVPASNFSIFNATSMVGRERALSQVSDAESNPGINDRLITTQKDSLESKANVDGRLLVSPEIGGQQRNEIGPSLEATATVQVSKSSILYPGNSNTLITLPEAIVAVWIFGMGFCLIRYILAQLALSRVIRNGRSVALESLLPSQFWSECYKNTTDGFRGRVLSRVRVIAVDDQFGPAVTGIIRPVVLLPQKMLNQYSQDELTMVITHELEHIRRFDTTLLFIAQLATTIHWFNPLSFWLKKRLQAEVEIAVDATTVRKLGLDKVKHYAELLFKVSSANNSPAYLLSMARRSSSFRQRIEQLTEIEPNSRFRASIGALAILGLILTGLSDAVSQESTTTPPTTSVSSNLQESTPDPSAATSDAPKAETARLDQPQPQQSQEDSSETGSEPKSDESTNSPAQSEFRSVSGQVVDAQGSGVPNAKLFYEYDKSTTQVTTDNAGNFTITLPRKPHPFDSFHTWVYADGFGLRVVAIKCLLKDDGDMAGVTIPLPPLERKATSIEVLDPEGQPVSGALIMPSKVDLPNGLFLADKSTGLISAIPEQLFESLAVRTDENGKASFDRFPNALWSGVRCQSDQFGIQLFEFRQGIGNAKIKLRKVGAIHGKIESYEPSKFPSLGFTIETKSQNGTSEVKGFASGKINENGEFMIPVIADGSINSFMIGNHETDSAQDCELICRDYKLEKVLPGKTLELVLTSPPTVSVSGVVLTSDTRVPVSGAVIVSHRSDSPHVRSYTTNQNGEFEIRVVPGQVGLQMISLSDSPEILARYGYTSLPDVVTEETRLEVLLPVRKSIKGELRDESGTPVANQRIRKFRGGVTHRNTAGEAVTDSEGKFEMFLWDNSIESNGSWATIDIAEYAKDGEIKSAIRQVSVKDDYYVLEQPSKPVAPKK